MTLVDLNKLKNKSDIKINGKSYNDILAEEKQEQIKQRMKLSRIDKLFLDNDFKVWHNELKKYDNIDWIGKEHLYIYGSPGTQKTGQITAICKKAIEAGKSVRYYRATELVYQRDLEQIKGYSLIVIDNLGYSSKFEESRGALFDFIDYRIHNYLSTILISNENLGDKFSPAFVDRINLFVKIKIDGKSQREVKK